MIFEKKYECISRDELEQLQVERLQATLNRVYHNVSFYKKLFDESSINIESVKSLHDLKHLPFTTKEDLRKSYPYDMFAVPLRDIVRIHSSSGTTGKPIVVGYTANDLNTWSRLVARVLTAADVSDHDFVQIAFNYSLITGGFGFHYGAEKLGASVIPSSIEDIERQIMIMQDFKTTALISTPGYAQHIVSVLEESNIHPESLSLKVGLFGAEPWSENLRVKIEEGLHINAYDNYGVSEIIGPGVAFECSKKNGLHINEDHFICEIIDPDTLEPVKEGEQGELVFTTITKQGFPLIRYRTGDISNYIAGECDCGRSLKRIAHICGRTDDMIILDGVNIFPSRIEQLILEIEGVKPHYQIILDRQDSIDTIEVKVEISPSLPFFDELKKLEEFKHSIRDHLDTTLGIKSKVSLVEPRSIKRSGGGKIKRVIDKRGQCEL